VHRGGRPSGKHGFWPEPQDATTHRQLARSAGQGSGENGLQADAGGDPGDEDHAATGPHKPRWSGSRARRTPQATLVGQPSERPLGRLLGPLPLARIVRHRGLWFPLRPVSILEDSSGGVWSKTECPVRPERISSTSSRRGPMNLGNLVHGSICASLCIEARGSPGYKPASSMFMREESSGACPTRPSAISLSS
jgi:hypothetical protein